MRSFSVMTPEQATFLLGFLLPQLKSEQVITQKILSTVPADKGDYRPDAKSRSAFELAWHIAVCEIWLLDAVIDRQFGDIETRPGDVRTCGEVAQWYAQRFAERCAELGKLAGEELSTPVNFLGLRNDPAVAYLNIAIRHSVHHRGQLSTYLRPAGAKVPAIYVESGDVPYPPIGQTCSADIPPPPAF